MRRRHQGRPAAAKLAAALGCLALALHAPFLTGQTPAAPPTPQLTCPPAPGGLSAPPACAPDRPLPINLPTALQLANVRPLDIALAAARIRVADADLRRANVLWLPTVYWGGDYYRHDGQIQAVQGDVFTTSKSSLMLGVGPNAVFAISDAIFAPLAARQVVRARTAERQTAANDTLFSVAQAYFNVQQARGELAAALDVAGRAEKLSRLADSLAPGLIPPAESDRARAELARRRQAVQTARERWQVASAELTRLLRLDRTALVEPLEPPHLRVELIDPCRPAEELIPVALASRPELASRQALVQASQQQLRLERWRPLIPSVWLRGASTPATGTLAAGYYGGGINSTLTNFSARQDWDLQLLWELQNLGLGNRARIHGRQAELDLSLLEQERTHDIVIAEVVQALANARSAAARLREAEVEVKRAAETAAKNFQGLGQARGTGNLKLLQLVVRPQEAVAAVQALAQAYADYYGAVGDYNRAQFRLYRALGTPAQALAAEAAACPAPTPTAVPPPPEVRPGPPEADNGPVLVLPPLKPAG